MYPVDLLEKLDVGAGSDAVVAGAGREKKGTGDSNDEGDEDSDDDRNIKWVHEPRAQVSPGEPKPRSGL